MCLTFNEERVLAVAEEIEPLIRLHFDEVARDRDDIPLDPDWGNYVALEESGGLRVYTARHNGRLVGYGVFFIYNHHHHGTLVAANDLLFLHPDHRKGAAGIKLIKFCEQQLAALGARKVIWHVKLNKDFRPILYRLGYLDEEVIVAKLI